jgi:MscS family membrane protein
MKKLSLLLFILSQAWGLSAQNANLVSPRQTVFTHLYNLQAETYHPEIAAQSFHTDNMSLDQRINVAIKLKQVMDAQGSFIDVDLLPNEAAFSDSANANRVYIIDGNSEIYLEKYGDNWLYSKSTSNKVEMLYRAAFPFGSAFFIKQLPHHLNAKILGIMQWQWLGIIILLIAALLVYYAVRFVVGRIVIKGFDQFGQHHFARKVIRPVTIPSGIIIASILVKAFYPSLLLGVKINHSIDLFLRVLIPVNAIYILYQLANIFGIYLQRIADKTESKMDDQLVPIIRKSLKVFIVILGVVFILQNLDFNITGLLAGLSIGGLALALAAQDTVKNFIGSFMIFIDKPFQIGDWVSGPGFDGTVEEVGFRATRIRTFRNSVQYVPNGKLADTITDNNGKRKVRRFNTSISITYDTPPEKIKLFTQGLRQLVIDDPRVTNDNYHIYLNSMNASSLDILFYIFFDVPEWGDELAAREKVILKIIELADAIEVRFAFPTQSLHIEDLPGQTGLTPIHNASKEEMNERIAVALNKFSEEK